MQILNFGSLNIDHVYTVVHIVKPGETIAADAYNFFAGGKGANQSVAIARAGGKVVHVGKELGRCLDLRSVFEDQRAVARVVEVARKQ